MRNSKALGAPAFLKSQGFAFEKIPRRIDAALLSALGPADRTRLQMIWSVRNMGFSSGLEMYEVPKTAKQAALLFSYDWPRAVATLDWFASALARVGAQSMAEMGCGAGFLLAYLKHQGASTTLGGIDAAGNLASIAAQLVGCEIVVGDYLVAPPPRTYDLVLCDFGFDTAKFAPSQKPHSISEIAGQKYCPNCSDDLKLQLDKYMEAWRRWGTDGASLALAGRLADFGMLRAMISAARDVGWELNLGQSSILKIRNIEGESERFPALLFSAQRGQVPIVTMEEAAQFFGG